MNTYLVDDINPLDQIVEYYDELDYDNNIGLLSDKDIALLHTKKFPKQKVKTIETSQVQ